MYTLNINGRLLDLSTPRIMGIINVTPDSFYDGGKTFTTDAIVDQARYMLNQGADILDMGGYSSRPGAEHVPIDEELDRIIPAIAAVNGEFPEAIISVDTFRSKVAEKAVDVGASLVNDISGGQIDKAMMPAVAKLQVPYICMHMRGTPQTMTDQSEYDNLLTELLYFFSERISTARELGINDFIADPGFGFSKNINQNFELLSKLELFNQLEVPLLVGISRKSMIYKTLGVSAGEALNGTTALHSIALQKGASILRVHDVKEAVECVKLVGKLKAAEKL